jgi:hypothetical protein
LDFPKIQPCHRAFAGLARVVHWMNQAFLPASNAAAVLRKWTNRPIS